MAAVPNIAPKMPVPGTARANLAGAGAPKLTPPTSTQYEPASVDRRFFATVIDGMVCNLVSFPLTFGVGLVMGLKAAANGADPKHADPLTTALTVVLSFGVAFLYYGWFNRNKGATPGKLLLGLRVMRNDDGTRLSYLTSACREIGKMTLLIGVLFAIFRKDKRALHDLMCNTKVMRLKRD